MELQTERLILRLLTPEKIRKIKETHTIEEQMILLGITDDERFKSEMTKFESKGNTPILSFAWFIIRLKENQEVIGGGGYHTIYRDHDRAELGYYLVDDRYKQKGYMKEALEAIIPYGFNELNLHRIEALVGPFNAPSLKLVQNFGFTREGHLKEHYKRDGIYEDSVMFSLLRQ